VAQRCAPCPSARFPLGELCLTLTAHAGTRRLVCVCAQEAPAAVRLTASCTSTAPSASRRRR
jgi:hypothetical protein